MLKFWLLKKTPWLKKKKDSGFKIEITGFP